MLIWEVYSVETVPIQLSSIFRVLSIPQVAFHHLSSYNLTTPPWVTYERIHCKKMVAISIAIN